MLCRQLNIQRNRIQILDQFRHLHDVSREPIGGTFTTQQNQLYHLVVSHFNQLSSRKLQTPCARLQSYSFVLKTDNFQCIAQKQSGQLCGSIPRVIVQGGLCVGGKWYVTVSRTWPALTADDLGSLEWDTMYDLTGVGLLSWFILYDNSSCRRNVAGLGPLITNAES